MLLPERPYSAILVGNREIREATPTKLLRRRNQAAILDISMPRRTYLALRDVDREIRQGSTIQLFYGLGSQQQRMFYGYLPSLFSDRNLQESDAIIHLTAQDFIGQLQDRVITLGNSAGSFLNPVGQEIGGLVATLAQTVIDSQIGTAPEFSIQGIAGTNPAQFVTESNAIFGSATAKAFVDSYTALAYDNSPYPDSPLLYEYVQRDQYLVWRKENSLTSNPAMAFTIGKDAVISGTLSRQPLYTDAYVSAAEATNSVSYSDRDSARRWGGKRFWASGSTSSSFQADAYDTAVRTVELAKNERLSYSLDVARDAFLLYPGDIIAVYGGSEMGIPEGNQRVKEVSIRMSPTLRTTVTVGETAKLLTDYL